MEARCDARPARRPRPRTGPASGAATRSPPRSPIPSATIVRIWATREAAAGLDIPASIPVTYADVADLGRMVPRDAPHQGIVAEVERLDDILLADLLDAAEDRRPLIVLDQVTDPHNVGAILRSAAAFGALGLVTQDRHAPPESGALAKAASGRARDDALGPRRQPRPRARGDGGGRLLADRADRRGGARRSPKRSARPASRSCSAPRAKACARIPRPIATRWRGCRSPASRASTSPTPPPSPSTRRACSHARMLPFQSSGAICTLRPSSSGANRIWQESRLVSILWSEVSSRSSSSALARADPGEPVRIEMDVAGRAGAAAAAQREQLVEAVVADILHHAPAGLGLDDAFGAVAGDDREAGHAGP